MGEAARSIFSTLPREGEAPTPAAPAKKLTAAQSIFAAIPREGQEEDESVPFGSIGRGFNTLQQTGNVLLAEAGIISPKSAAIAIARDEADKAQYPVSPDYVAGMEEMGAAAERGWGPLAYAMLTNPSTMLSVVGESIPASGAVLGAGLVGSVAGPGGTMAGAGAASFATEYASSIIETLQKAKVDINDPDAVEAALQNPELMSSAREKAVKRGIPIAMFDAISFGMAGRIAHVMGATVEGASKARKLAGGVVETAAQAGYGGVGEKAAQVAAGEEEDRRAIALEMGAEAVTGAPEIAMGIRSQRATPPPPGADATAEDFLPPEVEPPEEPPPPGGVPGVEIIPADQAPPAPTLTPAPRMVVDDPEFTTPDGEVLPAGPLHGQTVTVEQAGDNMSLVRAEDGTRTRVGNNLLKPAPEAAPPAPEKIAAAAAAPEQIAAAVAVPDSPRLTEQDRKSPIPNEIIDAGKATVEAATGKPSTFTTTQVIDGRREVTTGNVADLVAANRARTAATVAQITAGVAQPGSLAEPALAGPPVSVVGVAATGTPATTNAAPAPSIAIPEVLPEARFAAAPMDDMTRRYGPPGSQARTLEESRQAKGTQPIVVQREEGTAVEISHPYYETFEARIDGKKIGELNVSPAGPYASSVKVEPSARRQGVATALYEAAEAALGRPMTPSPTGMSGDAIAFWKKRFADMEPEQKQALLQQALDRGIEAKIGKSARARVDALGYIAPPAAPAAPPERVEAAPGVLTPTEAEAAPRAPDETDKAFAKRVVDKRPAPKTLPEKYDDYFIMDEPGTVVVPIGDLVSSKTDEENRQGGGNAAKRMEAGAKGELSKRGPITVKRMASGKYLIMDGNGTYTSVKDYGWKAMPVIVEEGIAAAPAEEARFSRTAYGKSEPAAQKALKEKLAAKRRETPAEGTLRETGQAVGEGHLTGFTGETATPEQRAVFYVHPFKTVDAIYEDAQARQDELAAACKEIVGRVEGVVFKNPGLKIKAELQGKIKRKGYKDAGQLTDCIRVGFNLKFPGQAGEIIRGLARHFEVLDEGWAVLDAGYVDRKVLVRFDDGRIGEIQFWEPHVLHAKEQGYPHIADGVKGKLLYGEDRYIEDRASPRSVELNRQMNELYGYALSLADSTWSTVIKSGKLSRPEPKYLNLRRQTSSSSSRQELRTSATSASTQSVEPGSSSALASKSVNTTGRSSQLQNFMGVPPSTDNVVQTETERKGETPRFQARTLREGTETAESIGLPPTREVTTPKGKTLIKKIRYNTRVIAAALEARQRQLYGTIERNDRSEEASNRIANWIVDEVEFERQPGREERSGVGWYSEKFQRALDAFGSIFPELLSGKNMMSGKLPGLQRLKTKKNARDFLTALIAITSDGALVAQNFDNAARLYGEFRQSGSIDLDKITFGGDRNLSIKTNVANILQLLEQYGPAGMHSLLMEEKTVSKLKDDAKVTGTKFSLKLQAHLRMPLAALIFGPKLGSFYANLMGASGYLTMDRWWSRTFNRYRGQLLKRVSGLASRPTDKQGNKIGLARFKEMIGQPNLSDEEALSEAMRHSKLYEEKGFKNGTDIEKTANTIRKDTIGTEDTPFGTVDRTFMIETVERARQKLADRGVTISLADIQAILWYYEKRLYSELGARETADISYEDVAQAVAQRAATGNRPRRPPLSATIEGPDGARFSFREDQAPRREGAGRGGEDRGRAARGADEAAQQAPEVTPLPGLYELYPASVGPNAEITAAKQAYMKSIGQPYRRQAEYVEADPKRGKRIADAFDTMEHNPSDPQVAAAYRALIDETIAQYRVLQKALKLKIEFIKPGMTDPYQASPRLALQDVMENGHLWVFPTEAGFGSITDIRDNPLLEPTDIVIDGHKLVANDVFRIVHDIYGHGPEGAGFGPTGEENAWQSHVRMYSPLAARAMTSETRGQNSWVNFGPYGEANRANPKNTTFADQKIGLLPDWVMTEGMATDEAARLKVAPAAPTAPPRQLSKTTQVQGGVIHFALSPAAVAKADAVWKDLRKILDSYGLTGVDLKVWQQIFADMETGPMGVDGLYLKNLIQVALVSQNNPDTVIHHEAVHALWEQFTDIEKAILTRKSQKEWITDEIKANYPKGQWIEEGVAYAHAEWRKGMRVDGVIAKIFRKINLILKAIARAFTGRDFRTAEDIFRQMATGEIGRRGQAATQFSDGKGPLTKFSTPPSGPNDPRFALQTPPHNQQQAQAVTQGFIARGQPIDRALRVGLQLFGGLDDQNRWRPTKRLTDKMGPQRVQAASLSAALGGAIGTAIAGPIGGAAGFFAAGTVGAYVLGSAPAPVNGKFGWFAGMAENAKRGLIDNYGLDPEYVKAYHRSDLGKTAILRQAAGIMKVLSNAGVGTREAAVLQAILSGKPVTDADMIRLAQPIRQAIDDLGAEAVSLGLISAESFERNRGAYLHRVYAKHEIDQGTLAGWVSAKMTSRRKKIIGDQLKGRGIFWDMTTERLMKDAGQHPEPTKGDKWRVLDRMSADGSKATKRVFFPTGKPVPMEFSGTGWVDRGVWEVRQIGKGKATLWRDYTEDERGKMGEIIDARYTIAKTFMLMANDLATGRFFKEVSEKAEWTQDDPPADDSTWMEGGEYGMMGGRYWTDPNIQWIKVPDTAIAKTGGKKRWGALSGKFVRAEIWRDLNEINIANNPGIWRKLFAQWKKNKTARNPVVHMNNIVSNVMFMDLADIRMQDLAAGLKAYASGNADFQEALEHGAFGSDVVSQELRDNVLKPILEEISGQQTANSLMSRFGVAGAVANGVWGWAKWADDRMLRAYQMEDEIFRMAAYMRRRSQGESAEVAAANARDQFLNYDIRAPWIAALRNSVFPFISYTYRAVPKLAESIAHRPWKLAKYATIAYAVNALSYMLDEGDDEEERERAALRDEEQGYSWLGVPRMIRMPWRDAHGLPVFLDVRRWIPAGDIFDSTQGSSAVPLPGPLHFGGPLQLAFEFMLNKQAFTGDEITNDLTDTMGDKAWKVADWAWKAWTPAAAWVPNSWYWTKISNAIYGVKPTPDAPPYSVPQAVLSSFGIKAKPVDVENGIEWHYRDFQKVQKELRGDMYSNAFDLKRGLIDQEKHDARAAKIMEKYENLGREVEEFEERIKKPKKAGG